jgi:NAD-dependent dihydropyrimidine dehydrogenase PreA subunit
MKPRRMTLFLLILGCVLLGAISGWLAGPSLANSNYIVKTAGEVWTEESAATEEDWTLRSEAFRRTGAPQLVEYWKARGMDFNSQSAAIDMFGLLYAQAGEIRGKFRVGGTVFGVWCGLVVGLSLLSAIKARRRPAYQPDPAHCVACGRCYWSCPVERERAGKA